MTDAQHVPGLAYDASLTTDCRAAAENLGLARLDSVARAAARPAPSIRFEDFGEVTKRDIDPAAAARRIAAALDLDLA